MCFELYHDLYIEPRKIGTELKPDAVLAYLLKRGVFRAGLSFHCPSCTLEFWIGLDEIATEATCEYCGHRFNVTPFLKDRDWRYRRSGLFGRDNNQEGAIPVILTLQQLATTFSSRDLLFATAMTLGPASTQIAKCETDFVAVIPNPIDGTIDVAIEECKTRQPITADDVKKLKTVAEAFPRERFNVYIIFSKLVAFTPEEVGSIRQVNDQFRRRAILFTSRELEPYHLYDRTSKEFKIDRAAVTFEQMANITEQVFLSPAAARAS